MQTVPATDDSQVYADIERSIGLFNKPSDGPFQPLAYMMEQASQPGATVASRSSDSSFLLSSGFPDLAIGDSENGRSLVAHESHMGSVVATMNDSESLMHCAAVDDGPRTRIDQRLDGPAVVQWPAEPGNAHQIVELIESDNFQDPDNNLTAAGREAIRASVTNTSFFQTYEGRAQQVQEHVNRFGSGILLSIDRDRANEKTARGSQPAIVLRIPDLNRPQDRNRDAIHRIPLQR